MTEILTEPQNTHSEECYRWHHRCAIAEVERLRAALADAHRAQRDAENDLFQALEALRGVIRVADRKTDEFDAARAALNKAEGKE